MFPSRVHLASGDKMPKKNPKQKYVSREDIINSFVAVTHTDPQTAVYVLNHYEWRFDAAVESFFASQTFYNQPQSTQPQINARKLEALYDKYKERFQPEKIGTEGVVKFLTDLKLDPASLTVLIIAWKFNAQEQCKFSRGIINIF